MAKKKSATSSGGGGAGGGSLLLVLILGALIIGYLYTQAGGSAGSAGSIREMKNTLDSAKKSIEKSDALSRADREQLDGLIHEVDK